MTAFHASGGSIFWERHPLSREDALWLLDLFRDEYRAGFTAGNLDAARAALRLSSELSAAVAHADMWRKASGGVRT